VRFVWFVDDIERLARSTGPQDLLGPFVVLVVPLQARIARSSVVNLTEAG
jgi:hypothetical protein